MANNNLNTEEQKQLVQLLNKLKPGFLPFEVFLAIARLVVLPVIEFVPLRLNQHGQVEILLLPRDEDDPIWPNELHVPGTVIRPTDTESKIDQVYERILKDELGGVKTSGPYYVCSTLHKSKRGTEQAQVFWVEVFEEPNEGVFYPVDNLPENVMKSQIDFIKYATKSFLDSQKST